MMLASRSYCSHSLRSGFSAQRLSVALHTRMVSTPTDDGSLKIHPAWTDPWESLGLAEPHTLDPAIFQLPEIVQVLQDPPVGTQKDPTASLQRAKDVFSSVSPSAHQSVQRLIAEAQHASGMKKTVSTIDSILRAEMWSSEVHLAKAKHLWLNTGDPTAATVALDTWEQEVAADPSVAWIGETARGIIKVCSSIETMDELFVVRDPLRKVHETVRRGRNMASAVAHLNLGTAEIIYSRALQRLRSLDDGEVPLDRAMRAWREGLTVVQRHVKKSTPHRAILEARLSACMAWGLLQMPTSPVSPAGDEYVAQASEFAKTSLKLYEKFVSPSERNTGLDHTLRLVAECYRRSGAAVTAEGLMETVVDGDAQGTLAWLTKRDAYEEYAKLCRDWERREGDAERWEEAARGVTTSLPELWQGKSIIHASLLMVSPSVLSCRQPTS